jgi:hypothetical protein
LYTRFIEHDFSLYDLSSLFTLKDSGILSYPSLHAKRFIIHVPKSRFIEHLYTLIPIFLPNPYWNPKILSYPSFFQILIRSFLLLKPQNPEIQIPYLTEIAQNRTSKNPKTKRVEREFARGRTATAVLREEDDGHDGAEQFQVRFRVWFWIFST